MAAIKVITRATRFGETGVSYIKTTAVHVFSGHERHAVGQHHVRGKLRRHSRLRAEQTRQHPVQLGAVEKGEM